jgi:hypothetical protein
MEGRMPPTTSGVQKRASCYVTSYPSPAIPEVKRQVDADKHTFDADEQKDDSSTIRLPVCLNVATVTEHTFLGSRG